MTTLQDNDLFLVERENTQYKVENKNMGEVLDTDLFLVEREGVQYKVTGDQVGAGVTGQFEKPVEVLTPLNGAGLVELPPYNPISSPIVAVGAGGSFNYETSAITTQVINSAWNQDKVWSDLNAPDPKLFDGNLATGTVIGHNKRVILQPNITIRTLGFYQNGRNESTFTLEINNGSLTFTGNAYENGHGWIFWDLGQDVLVNNIEYQWNTDGEYTIFAMSADGKELVDTGIPGAPSDGTTYTFTDSTNFDKFQVGDEVGSPGGASIATYTGNGASRSITGLGFSPDLVWIKDRDTAYNHQLYDSIRGVNSALLSNEPNTETNYSSFTSFDADGYTVPNANGTNSSGKKMVGWCWDAGDGSPVTNNDGTIQSTVKASDKTGFSIIKYIGNATQGATVGHGLSTAPSFVIAKSLENSTGWPVYHSELGANQGLLLNTSDAAIGWTDTWPSVPTDSVVVVGNWNHVNPSSEMIMYCWAETPGVSKFGSYSGNSGTNSITTGFEPAWVMVKRTNAADSWFIFDSKRGSNYLVANGAATEVSFTDFSFDSNGFTLNTSGAGLNASGGQYLYVAFSEEAVASITDIDELASQMTLDADVKDVGDTLSKTAPYDASLTCSDDTELANMVGPITMTDSNGDLITPQTSEIVSVSGTAPAITLTFADSTDLEYFSPGDVVQGDWDQSQVWSNNVTNDRTAYPAVNAFDGSLVTEAYADAGVTTTVTFDSPISVTNLRVYNVRIGAGTNGLILNGSVDVSSQTTVGEGWDDITGVSSLSSIGYRSETGADLIGIRAVEVNGKLLVNQGISNPNVVSVVSVDPNNSQMVVDGGEWSTPSFNDSQVWSNSLTSSSGFSSSATNAFDGDTNTRAATVTVGAGQTLTFAPTVGVSFTQTLEIYADQGGSDPSASWDGNSVSAFGGKWVTVYSGSGTIDTSKPLVINTNSTAQYATLKAVRLDGLILVDQGASGLGATSASLPTLTASATDVLGVDGNTIQINGVSGTWKTGLHIKGAEVNNYPPSPTDVVFTSMNGGTTPVTGTNVSLTKRVWTLEKSDDQNGPWTVVGEYVDNSANNSQNGATPWAGRPDLEPNTYYQVQVEYFSENAFPVKSLHNTFKTGDA